MTRLPEYVRPYWSLIESCIGPQLNRRWDSIWPSSVAPSDYGKVYYLTIQESLVEAGSSQRRPGLHVDSPGRVKIKPGDSLGGRVLSEGSGSGHRWDGHHWGQGNAHLVQEHSHAGSLEQADIMDENDNYFVVYGGIFIASSVANSSRVWDCEVAPEAVGR